MGLPLTHASRQTSDVLALARDGRVGRVVLGHVAGAAAAGGVGGRFDGRGDEVGGAVFGFAGDVAFGSLVRSVVALFAWDWGGDGGGRWEGGRG